MPRIQITVNAAEFRKIHRDAARAGMSVARYGRVLMGLPLRRKTLNSWQNHRDIFSSKFRSIK